MNNQPTKPQIKKWAKALRSGQYQQTTGELNNKDGFCCLGVACKLFIKKEDITYDGSFIAGGMPKQQHKVPQWLRVVNTEFEATVGTALSSLNDEGYSPDGRASIAKLNFNEIADLLEAVYLHGALKRG